MASKVPTEYLAGYAYLAAAASTPAAGIFIPLTTLTGLDAAEADAATGDIRKIMAEILDAFYASFSAKTEQLTKISILRTRNPSFNGSTLAISDTYSVSIERSGTIGDVVAE